MTAFRRYDRRHTGRSPGMHRTCVFERCEDRLALSATSGSIDDIAWSEAGGTVKLLGTSAAYFNLSSDSSSYTRLNFADVADGDVVLDGYFDFINPSGYQPSGGTPVQGAADEMSANIGSTNAERPAEWTGLSPIEFRTIATVKTASHSGSGWVALPVVRAPSMDPVVEQSDTSMLLSTNKVSDEDVEHDPNDDQLARPRARAVFFEVASNELESLPADATDASEVAVELPPAKPEYLTSHASGISETPASDQSKQANGSSHADSPRASTPPQLRPDDSSSSDETDALEIASREAAFEAWEGDEVDAPAAPVGSSNDYYHESLAVAVAALVVVEHTLSSRRKLSPVDDCTEQRPRRQIVS